MKYFEVAIRNITSIKSQSLVYHSEINLFKGNIVKIHLGQKQTYGVVIGKNVQKPKFKTKPIIEKYDHHLPEQLVDTVLWMSNYYSVPLPLVIKYILPSGLGKKNSGPLPKTIPVKRKIRSFVPTSEQKTVIGRILDSDSSVILHGQTGSGKTLIYRELIKSTLLNKKSALILIPEIGLTTQLVNDLKDLSSRIYFTHSNLTDKQRLSIWLHILQQKEPILVIGPRSSLFLPIDNLGLVIVDESHESSYKQDMSPRYQAQNTASYLAQQYQAKVVFGSATPRISDYYLAKSRNNPILELPKFNLKPPEIIVVDQKSQLNSFSKSQHLSNILIDAISQSLRNHHQSLVYINRRGTAKISLCNSCGWVDLCPNCDIALTLHHDLYALRCHQCGYESPIRNSCPNCQKTDLIYRGIGTKQLEKELIKLFPEATIARFDADAKTGFKLLDLYQKLHDGKIDIVIGTQMIAKGLDLPNLDVVGVVSADSELFLPDFSASERAFQLLYQVIGRAGRSSSGGKVIIQTYNPNHIAISSATSQNYKKFYDYEIAFRKEFEYPPFKHLAALICSYSTRQKAQESSLKLANDLKKHFKKVKILGPTPAFYEKRGNKYRWLIVLKSSKRQVLEEIAATYRSANWQTDLDPINLLY